MSITPSPKSEANIVTFTLASSESSMVMPEMVFTPSKRAINSLSSLNSSMTTWSSDDELR